MFFSSSPDSLLLKVNKVGNVHKTIVLYVYTKLQTVVSLFLFLTPSLTISFTLFLSLSGVSLALARYLHFPFHV